VKTELQTFSFGKNWKDFLSTVDEKVIAEAGNDIEDWLGTANIRGKSIVDIGSGSGLSSLCMYRRGCRRLVSFDYDPHSVEATKWMAQREGRVKNWQIFEGSILDEALIDRLGTFDIVHSWGVLHHTGHMWKAIDNAIRLCASDALFFISLYTAGHLYEEHLALKRRFNNTDEATKKEMLRTLNEQLIMSGSYKAGGYSDGIARNDRGMTMHNDVIDWLGGLPYEVAHVSEVLLFGVSRGLRPLRVLETGQGDCSVYLFRNDRNRAEALTDDFVWSLKWTGETGRRTVQRQLGEDLLKDRAQIEILRSELEFRRTQMESLRRSARRCLGIIRRRLFGNG